jgi:hypothetical protein
MSFADHYDFEQYDRQGRRVRSAIDPKSEGARQQIGGGLLGENACRAAGARAAARLSGASGTQAADDRAAKDKVAALCGSTIGELERWTAGDTPDEALVASIPGPQLQMLRALFGSDTTTLAARWRESLATTSGGGSGAATARLSIPIIDFPY